MSAKRNVCDRAARRRTSTWILLAALSLSATGLGAQEPSRERQAEIDDPDGQGAREAEGARPAVGGERGPDRALPEGVQLGQGPSASAATIGQDDLERLGQKLAAFAEQLSPTERLMMDWLFQRAAAAPADDPAGTDVEGFLFTSPTMAAGTAGTEPGRAGETEATIEITPAPAAALARALGMEMTFEPVGSPQRTGDQGASAPR